MDPQNSAGIDSTKDNQNLKDFYRLHYPQKKHSQRDSYHFRAKSVISVTERHNPEVTPKQRQGKKKHSVLDKINPEFMRPKIEQPKMETFSLKKALSGKEEQETVSDYFSKFPPRSFGTLQEVARRNTGVRNAYLHCKDEKLKVSKVLSSHRQSEQTKRDYLQLKQKELQEEKSLQIRKLFDQFFRKQYEEVYGSTAFQHFTSKLDQVVNILHGKLFHQQK